MRCYNPRYAGRRALHSFPTRRSSDLGAAALIVVLNFWLAGIEVVPWMAAAPWRMALLAPALLALVALLAWITFLDRKSTRLNSSHPSISYAVVCLEKKSYAARDGWGS